MSASNPDIWTIAVTWLSQHKSVIAGFAMSVSVALLRLRGDQQKTRLEKISEAVLCGLLTVTVYHGFRMFGLQHESAAIFIGGAVGVLRGSGGPRTDAVGDQPRDLRHRE